MTATSAASTLGDPWNRLGYSSTTPGAEPLPLGVRFSPPALATLDLPHGKILMVVDDAPVALDMQRMLHDAGYRVVGPAASVPEVQRMLRRGDIDCAILDLDIDRRTPLPVSDLLAFAEVPFVYLTTGSLRPVPSRHRHRPAVEKPFTRAALMAAVEKAMGSRREVANDNRRAAGGPVVPGIRVYPPL
jgi:DNA-binding NtrC family response regulator